MKRLCLLFAAVFTASCLISLADAPDSEFVAIYELIQEADTLKANGQAQQAYDKYLQAQKQLKQLQAGNPTWNQGLIKFRLSYVSERLASITPQVAERPSVTTAKATPSQSRSPELEQRDGQIRTLEAQIQQLQREREVLQAKVKEAFSAQPAAADPRELVKAEDKIKTLQKENEMLKVSLDQEQRQQSKTVPVAKLEQAEKSLAEAQLKVQQQAEAAVILVREKEALQNRVRSLSENDVESALRTENELLKKKLAETEAKPAPAIAEFAFRRSDKPLADANRKIEQQGEQISTLQADKQALQEQANELAASKSQLVQLQEENAALGKQLAEVRKQQQAKEEPTAREAERVTASEVQRLQASEAEYRRQSIVRENELKQQIVSLQRENKALERKFDDMASTRLAKLQEENLGLSRQLNEAKREAQAARGRVSSKKDARRDRAELERLRSTNEVMRLERLALEHRLRLLLESQSVGGIRPVASLAATPVVKEPDTRVQVATQERIQALEQERDQLRKEVNDARRREQEKGTGKAGNNLVVQVAALNSKLAILEAQKVPYTPEELALFKAPPVILLAQAVPAANGPKAQAPTSKKSAKDIPAGAGPLVAEAQRAFAARRFEEAEKKYQQVLQIDEKSVYALANLAAIQLEENKLAEAETNLKRALEEEPEDAFSLSLLGILRFRQEKYDEALEALSRSAAIDPANSETQNYLGITLSQKGQRAPAETALRKAIQLSPGNASAHYNLAVVYATQKPPYLELARLHYRKAINAGHPKNADLEKLFAADNASNNSK